MIAEDARDDEDEERNHVTAKLLVPSDQIGCVIGKGGQIVQNIRSETGAQIRILKDDRLPPCALNSDELVQVNLIISWFIFYLSKNNVDFFLFILEFVNLRNFTCVTETVY